jgi:putative membrane protein
MNALPFLLIALVIIGLFSSFVIWIVSKLKLGLQVDGFGSAFVAGMVIAVVAGILTWLLGIAGISDSAGLIGGAVHLVISIIALMISARLLPGLKVAGFTGALVASIAIGAFYWLGGLLLGQVI